MRDKSNFLENGHVAFDVMVAKLDQGQSLLYVGISNVTHLCSMIKFRDLRSASRCNPVIRRGGLWGCGSAVGRRFRLGVRTSKK